MQPQEWITHQRIVLCCNSWSWLIIKCPKKPTTKGGGGRAGKETNSRQGLWDEKESNAYRYPGCQSLKANSFEGPSEPTHTTESLLKRLGCEFTGTWAFVLSPREYWATVFHSRRDGKDTSQWVPVLQLACETFSSVTIYVLNFSIEPKKGCHLFVIAKWYKSCRTQMLIYLKCLHINSYWIKDDNTHIVFEGPLLVAVLWKDRIAHGWVFPHPFLTSNLQHEKAQHLCRVTWLCSKVTACCQGSLPSSPVNVSHWDYTKRVFGFLSSFMFITYSGYEASRLEKAAPQGMSGRV